MDCEIDVGCSDADEIDGYEASEIVNDTPGLKCFECARPIAVGERCEQVTGEFERESIDWRTCMDCAEIGDAFSHTMRVHGLLWEQFDDGGFDEFHTGCLTKLSTASAKAYLLERWREWKGLTA
jgi:hypothetical protein